MEQENVYEDLPGMDLGEEVTKVKNQVQTFNLQLVNLTFSLQLQQHNSRLLGHIKQLETDISKLCTEITQMKQTEVNLLTNISSLFKTAQMEISRKDRVIAELRSDLDNMIFRRGTTNNAKREAEASPVHISKRIKEEPQKDKEKSNERYNNDKKSGSYRIEQRRRSRSRSRGREKRRSHSRNRYYDRRRERSRESKRNDGLSNKRNSEENRHSKDKDNIKSKSNSLEENKRNETKQLKTVEEIKLEIKETCNDLTTNSDTNIASTSTLTDPIVEIKSEPSETSESEIISSTMNVVKKTAEATTSSDVVVTGEVPRPRISGGNRRRRVTVTIKD